MRHFRLLLIVPFLALALSACSTTRPGGYYQDDGPHASVPDLENVKEPVPRKEPLSRSGNKPYVVFGKTYVPMKSGRSYHEKGVASWYGKKFHGKRTSSGEPYDMYAMSAAHKTLPLPSYVRVTNLRNGRSVIVRVNDRGPFLHNRLIDLSYAAADRLGIVATGTGLVEVQTLFPDAPALTVAKAPASEDARIYLQAGAYSDQNNARRMQSRLRQQISHPVTIHTDSGSGRTLYRVRIGPLASIEESDRISEEVSGLGIANHVVVD